MEGSTEERGVVGADETITAFTAGMVWLPGMISNKPMQEQQDRAWCLADVNVGKYGSLWLDGCLLWTRHATP